MRKKISKFFVNIFLGMIPSSNLRKKLRVKLVGQVLDPTNKIILVHNNGKHSVVTSVKGLHIDFTGSNSKVIVHEPFSFNSSYFRLGEDSKIEIGKNSDAVCLSVTALKDAEVKIGEDFSCFSCNIENHDEAGLNISIGDSCMFSYGINIRPSDGHAIYDVATGLPINRPHKGIRIGNHVWLGMHVRVLKDVNIPNNTIVGACTIVTKIFTEPNTIIAGSPARVIRTGVNWNKENTDALKDLVCV